MEPKCTKKLIIQSTPHESLIDEITPSDFCLAHVIIWLARLDGVEALLSVVRLVGAHITF